MPPPAFSLPPSKAFSLLELLAALAVVAILTALLFSAITSLQKSAWAAADVSGLRRLGQAMTAYAADNDNIINQVSTSNPWDVWPEYFWTRASPYLDSNIHEPPLTALKLQSLAARFSNKTLAALDTRYLGNSPGNSPAVRVIQPFAFNERLFNYYALPRLSNGTSTGKAVQHFRRLTEFPRLASTPYVAVGISRFSSGTPGPLPKPDAIPPGVLWPYSGQKTIVVYLDGHAAMRGEPITTEDCWGGISP